MLAAFPAAGCRSVPPPRFDTRQPGWGVRQGQAIWLPKRGEQELAGDLLWVTNGKGSGLLQFGKPSIPLVTVTWEGDAWWFEIPPRHSHYQGQGKPPGRVAWLQLARALTGRPVDSRWRWETLPDNRWRLESRAGGERLEGY
ncbi:MAG TPA: hypothetical protein VHH73_11770, partial [Verrucomicrobiae bacterium]|nr:hypothetical protein [Verrucomicrobiae bacterium]